MGFSPSEKSAIIARVARLEKAVDELKGTMAKIMAAVTQNKSRPKQNKLKAKK